MSSSQSNSTKSNSSSEKSAKKTRWWLLPLINLVLILGVITYLLFIKSDDRDLQTLNREYQESRAQKAQNIASKAEVDPSHSDSTASSRQFNLETDVSNLQKGEAVKTLADFPSPLRAEQIILHTNRGDLIIDLYPDKTPLTVANFLDLAQSGFYDGIKFHRVIDNFMAQAGDPYSKDAKYKDLVGTGGPGYRIEDEFVADLKHDSAGVLSMANTGSPHTGGSQFFITFEPTPWLDGQHAVFGKINDEESLKILKTIRQDDLIFEIEIVK